MSVRKRKDVNYDAWLVSYRDAGFRRRHKTFATQNEAERFHLLVTNGLSPELLNGHKPIEFTVALTGPIKSSRAAIVAALPSPISPISESVTMHIIAEVPPRHIVADVDNFLKPILDALTGIVWLDDTQVCELLVRRIVGRTKRLQIKIWPTPKYYPKDIIAGVTPVL
jgi:Holliday junction resolvase RusA-like endonuclease